MFIVVIKQVERAFCNKMLTANKVYRKEDILAMENETVNPGFGKNGASNLFGLVLQRRTSMWP
jgi:hypothetical protein